MGCGTLDDNNLRHTLNLVSSADPYCEHHFGHTLVFIRDSSERHDSIFVAMFSKPEYMSHALEFSLGKYDSIKKYTGKGSPKKKKIAKRFNFVTITSVPPRSRDTPRLTSASYRSKTVRYHADSLLSQL